MSGRADCFYDPYLAEHQDRSHAIYRRLRDEAPIYHHPERGIWAISRFEDVWNATLDLETLSTEGIEEMQTLLPMLNFMDPPRHDRLRALVSRAFTYRRVNEMEGRVRALARELLDALDGRDVCEFVRAFAEPLPGQIIAEMIGVPPERRETFLSHTRCMLTTDPSKTITESIEEPSRRIYEEFALLLDERRSKPASDLMSALVAAEIDGEKLADEEILGFCYQLIVAGNDTTTSLIGNGTVLFAQHPEQQALLVREPGRIPNAVEEALRFEPPAQALPRQSRKPLQLHGRTIPADQRVLLVWAAANLDEREFEAPERFDVTRKITRHLAFGHGVHFCLGASLARMEARIAFEELLARYPDYALVREPGWVHSRWARAHGEIELALGRRAD
ncbi:MAG: cytochrome P450 [Deltaproteobacteria bacterium]|nr:cytochrome P450 [Deltaproteobacteria bacterium]